MADFSIIIPTYNAGALTRACVSRLLDQALPAEIIVVDDGSSDDTATALSALGDGIRVVALDSNQGFASACNAGARVASSGLLVFLNNDVVPNEGWLSAFARSEAAHPQAGVIGAKLLFPDGSVQHAGVAICQDGYPRHLYAGFPSDHPAVNKSRAFQAVTAACMLVRAEVFSRAGGFDTSYRNGFEDVDFCLRVRDLGYEVRYCHESVLMHLESASPGRFAAERQNARLFLSRWANALRADDVSFYLEDGLISIDYGERFRPKLVVDPLLGLAGRSGDAAAIEHLLDFRARQVGDLLRDLVQLTTRADGLGSSDDVDGALQSAIRPLESSDLPRQPEAMGEQGALLRAHEDLRKRDEAFEQALLALQQTRAADVGPPASAEEDRTPDGSDRPTQRIAYREVVRRLRELVQQTVPPDAEVLIVSKGDQELMEVPGRRTQHFPQDGSGEYAGYYPEDGDAAVTHLEGLRARGASFIVFPDPALWWLDHYPELATHLATRSTTLVDEPGIGRVFALSTTSGEKASHPAATANPGASNLASQLADVVSSTLPPDAVVAVATFGDESLLAPGTTAWHFPSDELGGSQGYALTSSAGALAALKTARKRGAQFLVIPRTAFGWMDECAEFFEELRKKHPLVVRQEHICLIFDLTSSVGIVGDAVRDSREAPWLHEPIQREVAR